MRDKLIELIKQSATVCEDSACPMYTRVDEVEALADYLLANGVIVPPCKVGDVVYTICGDGSVMDCVVDKLRISISVCDHYSMMNLSRESFSQIFFLTREEAERALREVQGDA